MKSHLKGCCARWIQGYHCSSEKGHDKRTFSYAWEITDLHLTTEKCSHIQRQNHKNSLLQQPRSVSETMPTWVLWIWCLRCGNPVFISVRKHKSGENSSILFHHIEQFIVSLSVILNILAQSQCITSSSHKLIILTNFNGRIFLKLEQQKEI